MSLIGRRLLQVRCYKTVRSPNGLTTLRDVHRRERQIVLDRQKEEAKAKKEAEIVAREEKKRIEAATPALVSFKLSCPGCGAIYQYQNQDQAGYLHYDTMMKWDSHTPIPCDRCEKVSDLEEHKMYSISEERFRNLLRKMSKRRSLGVVVADLVGFPATLPPNLAYDYPLGSPLILCLNKCDVIANTPGKLNIVQQYYLPFIEKWEKQNNLRFKEIVFVSGKTGLGLPELALQIQEYIHGDKYCEPLDVCYLIGLTNAGKSTLFNKLAPLMNKEIRSLGRVTESPLPGTTVKNISSTIQPPPSILQHKQKATAQKLDRNASKLEKLTTPSFYPPDQTDDSMARWFKSRIDDQLIGSEQRRVIVDTPGVLPNNSTPEAVFACQHKLFNQTVELHPGACLSFGWYKIYYVHGNVSLNLVLNVPSMIPHEIITTESDSTVGTTDTGVALCNKLYLLSGQNPRNRAVPRVTGDICLGNLGWVSVTVSPGDDATVLVFGPRLEDICYRTPGFHFRVPKFHDRSQRRNQQPQLGLNEVD